MATSPNAAFLYAAVEDLQGTVRAIDIKAEVLLIAMTVPLSDASGFAGMVWNLVTGGHLIVRGLAAVAALGLILTWIAAFISTFRVLIGHHNPSDAILDHSPAKGAFFAGHLFKFTRSDLICDRLVKSSKTLKEHIESLPATEEAVIAELAYEQLKLAFICSRKIAMFNFAVRLTIMGVYAGMILLVLRIFE
jgi:hypothetical protein